MQNLLSLERPIRIGLMSSRQLRVGPASPMIRFLREFEHFLTQVAKAEIYVLEGTFREILRNGLFRTYPKLQPVKPGYDGGVVILTSMVVRHPNHHNDNEFSVDLIIYFIDPTDATSLYPESLALKRECVVDEEDSPSRIFIPTYSGACEWATLLWYADYSKKISVGEHPSDEISPRRFVDKDLAEKLFDRPNVPTVLKPISHQTLALIAHDSKKERMVTYAEENFDILNRFEKRIATGTTGKLLNGVKPERLTDDEWELLEPAFKRLYKKLLEHDLIEKWVEAQASGPRGGDVQIAEKYCEGTAIRYSFSKIRM